MRRAGQVSSNIVQTFLCIIQLKSFQLSPDLSSLASTMTANQKVRIAAAMSFIEEKEEKLHGNISQHGRIYTREQTVMRGTK